MVLHITRGCSRGKSRSNSASLWTIALLLCRLCILSSGFLGGSPNPIRRHRQSTSTRTPPSLDLPQDCGLLALDTRTPLGFSCRYGYSTTRNSQHRHRRLSTLPPLQATGDPSSKRSFPKTFRNLLLRRPKPTARTSSYLVTMDKRRGYHRKTLGGLAQVVNNTDVNIMSPPEVASAIVGIFSSEAFK